MAEVINLRNARKRAKREQDDRTAEANRLAHGVPTHVRLTEARKREKADHDLERHRIDRGDDQ
ncbi:MAG: DUF4169 family protein [Pseudolabrys sp.]